MKFLIFLLAFVACQNPEKTDLSFEPINPQTTPSVEVPLYEGDNINGEWTTGCEVYADPDSFNYKTDVTIDRYEMVSVTTSYGPGESDCTTPRESFIYKISLAKDENRLFMTTNTYLIKLHHSEEVEYYNEEAMCSSDSWSLNRSKNVSETTCAQMASASIGEATENGYLLQNNQLEIEGTLYTRK